MSEVISLRDKLRAKVAESAGKFKCEIVSFEGEEFMVRQPSVAQRGAILERARVRAANDKEVEMNTAELNVWAVICCTYTPEGEPVFTERDAQMLRDAPAGGIVDALSAAALKLMNAEAESDAKNSVTVPIGKSSSRSQK